MNFAPHISIPENAPEITKIPEVPMAGLETLWLQIGGTVCNLTCTHCFISCTPQNNNHPLMTLAQVQKHLEESKHLGIKD